MGTRISRASRGASVARLAAMAWLLGAMAALTACGAGGDEAAAPVTVTFTRTPSVTSAAPPSQSAPVASPTSAVAPMARAFDAGLITGSRTQGEILVLAIDRLTVAGIDDTTLAAAGALVEPDPGDRFGNQRVALYEVAVAPDAVFVVTTCTRGADGVAVASEPVTAQEFLDSVAPDAPVIFQYTAGTVSRAELNPRC